MKEKYIILSLLDKLGYVSVEEEYQTYINNNILYKFLFHHQYKERIRYVLVKTEHSKKTYQIDDYIKKLNNKLRLLKIKKLINNV